MKRFILFICLIIGGVHGRLSAQTAALTSQSDSNGLYGFVDSAGNFVIAPQYDEVNFEFYNNVACVRKGKKFLFIDTSGKEISKSYDWAGVFDDNNMCLVNSGGKIDEYGVLLGGKYGYVDLSGQEVIPAKYARIGEFNEYGMAIVNEGGSFSKNGDFEGGKNGFITRSGTIVVNPKYSYIGDFDENGIAWINVGGKLDDSGECKGGNFGYINAKGEEIVAPKYSFVGKFDYATGLCWVNKGGKIFTTDKKIEKQMSTYMASEKDPEKIRAKRLSLENAATGGKYDVMNNRLTGGKYGFVNIYGDEVLPVVYDQTSNEFTEGYAWVYKKKYGYVNSDGTSITDLKYDAVEPFHNGIAAVMKYDKKEAMYGYINTSGREITPIQYVEVGTFEDGYGYVKTKGGYDKKTKKNAVSKYGFVDANGNNLTPAKYDWVGNPSNGITLCRIGTMYGFVNNTGKEITPFIFTSADAFKEDVTWAKLNQSEADKVRRGEPLPAAAAASQLKQAQKLVLIDKEGSVLTDAVYTSAYQPTEGRIAATDSNDKSGWLDYQGNVAIPFIYDNSSFFSDGVAAVKKDGKWGYIDPNGNIVIECKYSEVSRGFVNGVAGVKVPITEEVDLWGGITRDGEFVVPTSVLALEDLHDIVATLYLAKGAPLTPRDVFLYYSYKTGKTYRPSLTTTIPDIMWAY